MRKRLLVAGGVINVLFTVFHIWLTWQLTKIAGLTPEIKALLIMLCVGGTTMIGFAAYTSLFCIQNMLTTKLGKATLLFIILIYSSRAVEEIVLEPHFSALIFVTCLITALVYGLVMVLPHEKKAPGK